jgi:hypothetical protein
MFSNAKDWTLPHFRARDSIGEPANWPIGFLVATLCTLASENWPSFFRNKTSFNRLTSMVRQTETISPRIVGELGPDRTQGNLTITRLIGIQQAVGTSRKRTAVTLIRRELVAHR